MIPESSSMVPQFEPDEALTDLRRALRALDERVRAELDVRPILYRRAGSLLFVGIGIGLLLGLRPTKVELR